MTNQTVVGVDGTRGHDVLPRMGDPAIATKTAIWAPRDGVRARSHLAELEGRWTRRVGVTVQPTSRSPVHPEVIVLGDMVRGAPTTIGKPVTLPGVAPAAIQQGIRPASSVRDRLAGRSTRPFRYATRAMWPTIGRGGPWVDPPLPAV